MIQVYHTKTFGVLKFHDIFRMPTMGNNCWRHLRGNACRLVTVMEMALRGVEGALATQPRPSGASGRSTAPRLILSNPQNVV